MHKHLRFLAIIISAACFLSGCLAAVNPGTTPTATTAPTVTVPATTEADPAYIEVWREGEASQIPVQWVTGQAGSYRMAMDPSYFTFRPQEGADLFSYDAWEPAQAVYYRIQPWQSAYDVGDFVTGGVPAGYSLSQADSITLASFPACEMVLTGTDGHSNYVIHKYLIDCGDTCYTIEARFTFEMYEGLFSIMYACFETFRLV